MLQHLWKYLDASARILLAPERHWVRDSLCICRKRALARAWSWARCFEETISRELTAEWILSRNGPPSLNQQVAREKEEKHRPKTGNGS